MEHDTKACTKCAEVKVLAEFRTKKLPSGKPWRSTICKTCERASNKAWRETNREYVRERRKGYNASWAEANAEYKRTYAREYYRKRRAEDPAYGRTTNKKSVLKKHGLTEDDFDRMVAEQDNSCAICGRSPGVTNGVDRHRLVIDHDHTTGKVRALLCDYCNRGLGIFGDDPSLLIAAAMYIDQHREVVANELAPE